MYRKLGGFLLMFLASAVFAAGGPIDGIYSCGVTLGTTTSQVYVTVNGQPDGQSIFAVAAVTPSTNFYGYGIGQVSGSTFSGQTMFLAPFNFSISGNSFAGPIGILSGGSVVNAIASCSKIW